MRSPRCDPQRCQHVTRRTREDVAPIEAPEHDVETERAAELIEEDLHAGLTGNRALERIGTELVGIERQWHPGAAEERRRRARRVELLDDDEQVTRGQLLDHAT